MRGPMIVLVAALLMILTLWWCHGSEKDVKEDYQFIELITSIFSQGPPPTPEPTKWQPSTRAPQTPPPLPQPSAELKAVLNAQRDNSETGWIYSDCVNVPKVGTTSCSVYGIFAESRRQELSRGSTCNEKATDNYCDYQKFFDFKLYLNQVDILIEACNRLILVLPSITKVTMEGQGSIVRDIVSAFVSIAKNFDYALDMDDRVVKSSNFASLQTRMLGNTDDSSRGITTMARNANQTHTVTRQSVSMLRIRGTFKKNEQKIASTEQIVSNWRELPIFQFGILIAIPVITAKGQVLPCGGRCSF